MSFWKSFLMMCLGDPSARRRSQEPFGKRRANVQRSLFFIRAVADLILDIACFIPRNQELADRSHATRKWGSVWASSELESISRDTCCVVDTSLYFSMWHRWRTAHTQESAHIYAHPSAYDILPGPYPNLPYPVVIWCHWLDTWLTRTL